MNLRKRSSVVALLTLALVGGGVAWAAWLVSGTGTATSQAATVTSLEVSAGTPQDRLYPGGATDLQVLVDNPNPFPVTVTQATFGAVTVTPQAGKTCAAADVATAGPLALSAGLAAESQDTALLLPDALSMLTSAADGCQGASFSVQVTLTAQSA
ncbi:hypothetical protein [Geodermatophilus sp. DSM 44513]|uniref:hypothetical protein n=1 Tax=Geodermatophilus sp. DSM 44513 TaxID=1528104 RepID=UPI001283F47D|nr:hypothetical protein [Geodermatophilus sp. DSM 44513]WNV75332.1 hypothetical protein RTG05_20510 [Geodermatophilus sp. DSM 44513]